MAYTRGEMAHQVVRRCELDTGRVETRMAAEHPAWSVALSPDGREVAFVSAASGEARITRTDAGALPTERFPTMPVAPIWTHDDRLVFEDEQGVASVDLGSGATLESRGALRSPVRFGERVWAREGARWELLR